MPDPRLNKQSCDTACAHGPSEAATHSGVTFVPCRPNRSQDQTCGTGSTRVSRCNTCNHCCRGLCKALCLQKQGKRLKLGCLKVVCNHAGTTHPECCCWFHGTAHGLLAP